MTRRTALAPPCGVCRGGSQTGLDHLLSIDDADCLPPSGHRHRRRGSRWSLGRRNSTARRRLRWPTPKLVPRIPVLRRRRHARYGPALEGSRGSRRPGPAGGSIKCWSPQAPEPPTSYWEPWPEQKHSKKVRGKWYLVRGTSNHGVWCLLSVFSVCALGLAALRGRCCSLHAPTRRPRIEIASTILGSRSRFRSRRCPGEAADHTDADPAAFGPGRIRLTLARPLPQQTSSPPGVCVRTSGSCRWPQPRTARDRRLADRRSVR